MIRQAFIDDENKLFDITYYHNPKRWTEFAIEQNNPITNEANWSKEIKYLNDTNDDVSDEIKKYPQ